MNTFKTIRFQAALALVVAASAPQVAGASGYKPFVTDFGGDAKAPQVVSDSGYKPFVTDFGRDTTSSPAASQYTPAAVQAMGARYAAMAKWYAAHSTRQISASGSDPAVAALGARYDAMAKWYATHSARQGSTAGSTTTGYVVGGQLIERGQSYVPEQPPYGLRPDDRGGIRGIDTTPAVVATASSQGFDWTDAGIGAAGGLGLSLLVAGALVLGLSTRRGHSLASA